MIIIWKFATVFSLIAFLGACNSVTYHHSERNSIALESRTTDPQQPVQGVIGVKTRTVVVTPKKDEETGEPSSVISDFQLKRTPNDSWYKFGATTVNSAFITGHAAVLASPNSALAIQGLASEPISNLSAIKKLVLGNVYLTIRQLANKEHADMKAKAHLDSLNKLHKLLPEEVSLKIFTRNLNTITEKEINISTLGTGFEGVWKYLEALENSIRVLNYTLENRSVKFNGNDIDRDKLNYLKESQKELVQKRKNFARDIGNNPAIDRAAAYAISII